MAAPPAYAQRIVAAPFDDDWRTAWSPLALAADLAPLGPRAPALPDLLLRPPPGVGLAWTAGGGGMSVGLARGELRGSGAQFGAWQGRSTGTYRRALDPAQMAATALGALGWRALGDSAAWAQDGATAGRRRFGTVLAGRVALDSRADAGGTFAQGLVTDGTSPLVPTDTGAPDLARTHAVLEGAVATRYGPWRAGLAAGYEVASALAERSRVARQASGSAPGLALSVGRALWQDRVTLAVQARWVGRAETVLSSANPGLGTFYQFTGFGDPPPIPLTPGVPFYRRTVRDGRAYAVGAEGRAWDAHWALSGELSTLDEGQWSRRSNAPPKDRWVVDARTVVAGAQREVPLLGLVTVRGRVSSASGAANRADLRGTVLALDRREGTLDLEARRIERPGQVWAWAATSQLGFSRDERRDGILRARAAVNANTAAASAEVGRALGRHSALAIGLGLSGYVPAAAIPTGASLGPIAQRLIAPTLEWVSAGALATQAAVTVRRRLTRSGTAAWLRVGEERTAPWRNAGAAPDRPTGSRTAWRVAVGITTP